MSVAKVIELISEGASVEEAVSNAAAKATKTLRNVTAVNVENVKALVENGKVVRYRVDTKVTFVLED